MKKVLAFIAEIKFSKLIAHNVSRLCFVAEKQAKSLDLKTKLTNTNRTLVNLDTAIEQNRCYK